MVVDGTLTLGQDAKCVHVEEIGLVRRGVSLQTVEIGLSASSILLFYVKAVFIEYNSKQMYICCIFL